VARQEIEIIPPLIQAATVGNYYKNENDNIPFNICFNGKNRFCPRH
jgi:hypothetical protein